MVVRVCSVLPCDCPIFLCKVRVNSVSKGVDGGVKEELREYEQISEIINPCFSQP